MMRVVCTLARPSYKGKHRFVPTAREQATVGTPSKAGHNVEVGARGFNTCCPSRSVYWVPLGTRRFPPWCIIVGGKDEEQKLNIALLGTSELLRNKQLLAES